MAKITGTPQMNVEITLTLNEDEAAALVAFTEYGIDKFLEFFYTSLGRAILYPHENGAKSMLLTAKQTIPPILSRIKVARDTFNSSVPK